MLHLSLFNPPLAPPGRGTLWPFSFRLAVSTLRFDFLLARSVRLLLIYDRLKWHILNARPCRYVFTPGGVTPSGVTSKEPFKERIRYEIISFNNGTVTKGIHFMLILYRHVESGCFCLFLFTDSTDSVSYRYCTIKMASHL